MSQTCYKCHKKAMRGNLVSHSKQRTHRHYKLNLHPVKTVIAGVTKTIRVCTKCLRRIKKAIKPVTTITSVAPATQPVPAIEKEVKVKTTTIEELMKEQTAPKTEEKKPKRTKLSKSPKSPKSPK